MHNGTRRAAANSGVTLRTLTFLISTANVVSGQLFIYPPVTFCSECLIPDQLGIPYCETTYLSECYCENWAQSDTGIIAGRYITTALQCAQSNCTVEAKEDLGNYFSALCSAMPLQRGSGSNKEETPFAELMIKNRLQEGAKNGIPTFSSTCSQCFTTFLQQTNHRCTPSDLDVCMCSAEIFDAGVDQFSQDCPCAAEAQEAARKAEEEDGELRFTPAMMLLGCLRGRKCGGRDKALLARWGEVRCAKALFSGEEMYGEEWKEEEEEEERKKRRFWGLGRLMEGEWGWEERAGRMWVGVVGLLAVVGMVRGARAKVKRRRQWRMDHID
ncbi:hypothetical protein BDZ91DRAFT_801165 [Kalaharituber pfeilii]|nr:hypothetical protein BDZ91DRAFT_801165 [Kalaharituber pfeilii]